MKEVRDRFCVSGVEHSAPEPETSFRRPVPK
jgi:hypothetical protein